MTGRLRAALAADPGRVYRTAGAVCVLSALTALALMGIYGRSWVVFVPALVTLASAEVIRRAAIEIERRKGAQ